MKIKIFENNQFITEENIGNKANHSYIGVGRILTTYYQDLMYDKEEKARYSLDQDLEIKLSFVDDKYNILVIKDGKASIEQASCPDKICVRQNSISKTGQTITCLPNKTVIKIIGDTDSGVDVVS